MKFSWFVDGLLQETASTRSKDVRKAFKNPKYQLFAVNCTVAQDDFEGAHKVENKNLQNLIFHLNDIWLVCGPYASENCINTSHSCQKRI